MNMKNIFKLGDIMRTVYSTKQKEKILDRIKRQEQEFTIKSLYEGLEKEIGLTTIYRFIDKMLEEGTLKKITGKGTQVFYQYLKKCPKENHFYLKCDQCGEMIHVDCDCIKELSSHIDKEHSFQLKEENIMIKGTCKKCLKEMK